MKVFRNIAIAILIVMIISIIVVCSLYNINIKAVDKNDSTKIEVVIPSGTNKTGIGKILEEKELIRSSKFFSLYIKLFDVGDLKAGTYYLSKNMDLKEILDKLKEGNSYNPNQISITFKEGINIRKIASIIEENTNNSYDDVMALLKDDKYLDELIETYWFISKDIKNDKLYYSLEGYLFPETYYFSSKDVSVKEVFTKMLNQMDKVLTPYKSSISKSDLSIHEILTLASIVEKEGKQKDFNDIASTFYNRINKNMALQSCATSYYGMGMDFNEVGIATSEMLSNKNDYNTYVLKALPVGPISSPSSSAIESVIVPKKTNNLYFLSDNEGNTYFFETYKEHQQKEAELKRNGKWDRS